MIELIRISKLWLRIHFICSNLVLWRCNILYYTQAVINKNSILFFFTKRICNKTSFKFENYFENNSIGKNLAIGQKHKSLTSASYILYDQQLLISKCKQRYFLIMVFGITLLNPILKWLKYDCFFREFFG